jgi:hypothetical protein
MRVVLPLPLAPTMAVTEFSGIVKDRSERTFAE